MIQNVLIKVWKYRCGRGISVAPIAKEFVEDGEEVHHLYTSGLHTIDGILSNAWVERPRRLSVDNDMVSLRAERQGKKADT